MTDHPGNKEATGREALNAGINALQNGNVRNAVTLLQRARKLLPDERLPQYWLANALRQSGDPVSAEKLFKALLTRFPDDEDIVFAYAFLLRDAARMDDISALLVGFAQRQDRVNSLLKASGFLRDCNRFDEAIALCERAVELAPGQADLRFKLARMYQSTGRFDQALALTREALDLDPGQSGAWISLSRLKKFTSPRDEDIARMQKAATSPLTEESAMCIEFALAKAMDDLGESAPAWDLLQSANQRARRQQPWDRQRWQSFVVRRTGQQPPPGIAPADAPITPVFIVGMLRSGTTLLESRLAKLPGFRARGELNFLAHADTQELSLLDTRQLLLQHLARGGQNILAASDKNPLNFRYLDRLHASLPEARVVHMVRDGRDSCLSCFLQLFQHPDAAFANGLDELKDFYEGYQKLMAHWKLQFPGWILEIRYRDLVEQPAATLETVCRHVGIPWDVTALEDPPGQGTIRTASSWQARQAIHRDSLGKWESYGDLAPEFFLEISKIDQAYARR